MGEVWSFLVSRGWGYLALRRAGGAGRGGITDFHTSLRAGSQGHFFGGAAFVERRHTWVPPYGDISRGAVERGVGDADPYGDMVGGCGARGITDCSTSLRAGVAMAGFESAVHRGRTEASAPTQGKRFHALSGGGVKVPALFEL